MERHPDASRERRDRLAAVAVQFCQPCDDGTQDRGDADGVQPRQHDIDRGAGAVAGDKHRELLRRQAPLGGRATPRAGRPWQIGAFALEEFRDERLTRLDEARAGMPVCRA